MQLSAAVTGVFPAFAIEAKKTERPSILRTARQALCHAQTSELLPMVCFKGNKHAAVAVMCGYGLHNLGHEAAAETNRCQHSLFHCRPRIRTSRCLPPASTTF
jgi:hypothetical protein